ncbi:MAG: nicotinate-nucleotide adenylyltransferase [Oscillospiraceae bacterium]|nr:nicotinate-nucleotide adenylyltransferase [Oscillospiraceae bacterium]
MVKIGAVCGRFQIFHNDHLHYALAAKERCEHLIVGITSPDVSVSPEEKVDPHRTLAEANPCTYYERMKMVEGTLLAAGLDRKDFDIVPFPIGKPELIRFYVPAGTHIFTTILDEWGHTKTDRLKDFGYSVEVLWERNDKVISSSLIRQCIMEGRPWLEYVPEATYRYVIDQGIDQRIKGAKK